MPGITEGIGDRMQLIMRESVCVIPIPRSPEHVDDGLGAVYIWGSLIHGVDVLWYIAWES
jgi:hypothetical protein